MANRRGPINAVVALQRLDDIRHVASFDPERAAGAEADLRGCVLQRLGTCRRVPADLRRLARLALSTDGIKFPRWGA
jgi:hypothetical protein